MYNNPAGPSLAATGLVMTGNQIFWYILAVFALISLGTALMRIVPRRAARQSITTRSDFHRRS